MKPRLELVARIMSRIRGLTGYQMGSLAIELIIKGENSKVTVVQSGVVKLEELSKCVLKNDVSYSEFKTLAEKLSI